MCQQRRQGRWHALQYRILNEEGRREIRVEEFESPQGREGKNQVFLVLAFRDPCVQIPRKRVGDNLHSSHHVSHSFNLSLFLQGNSIVKIRNYRHHRARLHRFDPEYQGPASSESKDHAFLDNRLR